MNFFSTLLPSWLHVLLLFLLCSNFCTSWSYSFSSSTTTRATSYNDHCADVMPESFPTTFSYINYPLGFVTAYFTGGNRILDTKDVQHKFYSEKSLSFKRAGNAYETETPGIYKIRADLYLRSPYWYNSRYNSHFHRRSATTTFSLEGLWSESSKKLCMVGSASWRSKEGKLVDLDAVLKLKYPSKNATIFTSMISGSLESINSPDNSGFFDPISIFHLPLVSGYNYSLVSNELDGGWSGGVDLPNNQSASLEPSDFRSMFSLPTTLELEYAAECKTAQNCTPFHGGNGSLPPFMYWIPFQHSTDELKLRYMITFGNDSYSTFFHSFDANSTLIGEGTWDVKKNRLLVAACRILGLYQANLSGNVLGDCTVRFSLQYPTIRTIRTNSKIVGRMWTNKTVNDSGYFRNITFGISDNDMLGVPGLKYKYTEFDRVRKSCLVKKIANKDGTRYPNAYSHEMDLDMTVKHSNGQYFGWGHAVPMFVGNELYHRRSPMVFLDSWWSGSSSEVEESTKGPMNISYKISFSPLPQLVLGKWFSALNLSMNRRGKVQITAEGVYDDETGYLCMVGCRTLSDSTNESVDCQISVTLEFPPVNARKGEFTKGTIRSTRAKTDSLYFEDLSISSAAYNPTIAKRTIWRMDLEITMVLISNTLTCIFVALQLFHMKRNPGYLPNISLIMLLILCLGHMIPLVLNFEALFLGNRNKQRLLLNTGGWLEANEVTVRVVTMVAFLLQVRLLQLTLTARLSDGNEKGLWAEERKAAFASCVIYLIGGIITLILHWMRNRYSYQTHFAHHLWGDLRSYAGLVLDGFLFPQILLNLVRGSVDSTLSPSFYIGTTLVRLLPHAYDIYRANHYAVRDSRGYYYYANHNADFYSTAWNVVIPCGCIALALIIFLQQRSGGCCILPQRFRELEQYKNVPAVDETLLRGKNGHRDSPEPNSSS